MSSAENGPSNDGNQSSSNISLEKANWPRKNEIYIKRVFDLKKRFLDAYNLHEEDFPKNLSRARTFIMEEMMTDNPVIRAPIEIAKGEKLGLGVTRDQIPAFALIYDMNVSTEASHYASIESKGNKLEDVEIKFLNTIPQRHINNILISKALAEKLEVKEDQEIKILRIYQKASDINLDEV